MTSIVVRSRAGNTNANVATLNVLANGAPQVAKNVGAASRTHPNRAWSVNPGPGTYTIGVRAGGLGATANGLSTDYVLLDGTATHNWENCVVGRETRLDCSTRYK